MSHHIINKYTGCH